MYIGNGFRMIFKSCGICYLEKKQCKHIADDAGMTSFVFEAKQRKYVYKLSMQCSKSTCNT